MPDETANPVSDEELQGADAELLPEREEMAIVGDPSDPGYFIPWEPPAVE